MTTVARVNRRIALQLASGLGVTLIVGGALALVFRRDSTASLEPARLRLLELLADRQAADVIAKAALPVLGSQEPAALVEEVARDLELPAAEIALASATDLERRLATALERDCDRGAVMLLDGWIVPLTLARLSALAAAGSG